MKAKHQLYLLAAFTLTLLPGFNVGSTTVIRSDLKSIYESYKVDGSFILFDQKNDQYTIYNQQQTTQLFTPASTFKICNSLIALSTGVIKDENEVLKWDGVDRQLPAWNKDTDMRNAFKNSTVWFYQELARRTGPKRMKEWLDKAHYGNADITGGIDAFWLSGKLRISPKQQIDFLRNLQSNSLPFPQRSMTIVKEIMVVKDTAGYVIRAKTGWGKQDNKDIGWYVGYVTTKDNTYYFSNCIQSPAKVDKFGEARMAITYEILEKLKVLKR